MPDGTIPQVSHSPKLAARWRVATNRCASTGIFDVLTISENFWNIEFWQQFVATILGVVLGIPAGLWLNRRQERQDVKKSSQERNARRSQLRRIICTATDSNRQIVMHLREHIDKNIVFFNVDTTVLDSTSAAKYELLDDLAACLAVDALRFHLHTLYREIELLLRVSFDGSLMALTTEKDGKELPTQQHLRTRLIQTIQSKLTGLETECRELVSLLGPQD